MTNLYYDVKVDIQKSNVIDSGLRFTQGDKQVLFLRIMVTNGNAPFDASNTTPSINFVKPDGTFVVGTPVKDGDYWVYQFLGNEIQSIGKVLCDIKFTYESGRISSSKFTFYVEKDTTITDASSSSSYIAPMEEILSEMSNYRNQGISLAEQAEIKAIEAKSYATGGTGTRPNEETDNAKYYYESVKAITNIGIATTTTPGIVMPDGDTILVDAAGKIEVNIDNALSDTSEHPVQNMVVKGALDLKADQSVVDLKADQSTVDGKADKATTLAGYEIADAYTKDEIDTQVNALTAAVDSKVGKLIKIDGTATGTTQTITIPAEAKNKELYFVTKNSADTAVGAIYPMVVTFILPNCGDLDDNKGIFFAGGTGPNRLVVGKLNNNIYSNMYWSWNGNAIQDTMITEIYYRA